MLRMEGDNTVQDAVLFCRYISVRICKPSKIEKNIYNVFHFHGFIKRFSFPQLSLTKRHTIFPPSRHRPHQSSRQIALSRPPHLTLGPVAPQHLERIELIILITSPTTLFFPLPPPTLLQPYVFITLILQISIH
jgi:hypothetical protein